MKKKKITVIVVSFVILIAACIGSKSFHYANQNEYNLILRFGKINKIVSECGYYFINPFIDSVTVLPKEVMIYDIPASDVITSDKKTMIVDEFVLWRITDPALFAQTLNSSISNAEYRIDTLVFNATKNVISATKQEDVISGRDGRLVASIMENLGDVSSQYGMEIISVETKRLDLPDDNKAAVYQRMISERETIAAEYTAQGSSEAQIIINETDRTVNEYISNAEAEAAVIIAEGEAEYMRILAEAYDTDEKKEFYAFILSLEAAKNSLGDDTTLMLDKESLIAQIFLGY